MRLKDLIENLEAIEISGNMETEIENVVYSSKEVTPNSLFICIKGFKTDGHLYIEEAVNKGAVAVVSEEAVAIANVTVIRVLNTRSCMATISNRFFSFPSHGLDIIGVTGTNGKTSITYMIKAILEASGRKTGLIGTIATIIGEDRIEASRTTPEAIDMQRYLRKMVDNGLDSCVMEVSSHSLELNRVDEVRYQVGIFTNLTPDHLDFHKDLESYRNAKKKLFHKTQLGNIINLDDDHGRIIAAELKDSGIPLYTYGIKEKADFTAKSIQIDFQSVSFDVVGPDFQQRFTLGIPVMFAVYNALAVIAACSVLKIPLTQIVEGLRNFTGIPGRFELIKEIKRVSVIVDYAHTPDALENVLKAASGFTKNRLITVFGCGGDRDMSKRPLMGEIAGRYSNLAILTSDNPRTENPYQILEMIETGIKSTGGKYYVIEDRREAIRQALQLAVEGDIIIIAGKGHETYQIVGNQTYTFDDRKVAIEIAREEGII